MASPAQTLLRRLAASSAVNLRMNCVEAGTVLLKLPHFQRKPYRRAVSRSSNPKWKLMRVTSRHLTCVISRPS